MTGNIPRNIIFDIYIPRNLFLSEQRSFGTIKVEVVKSFDGLMAFYLRLYSQFHANLEEKFKSFSATDNEVRDVHAAIVPDLDLASIDHQYDNIRL